MMCVKNHLSILAVIPDLVIVTRALQWGQIVVTTHRPALFLRQNRERRDVPHAGHLQVFISSPEDDREKETPEAIAKIRKE